ncbi:unnamed protein product [Prunus armeniaca]
MDWSMKLDNSASYEVRFEVEWLMYCTVLDIGIHSKSTKSPLSPCNAAPQVLDIIDMDWSMKLDNSTSYEVPSEMEWLVYCTVLDIGIHSKSTKSLLLPCYDAPQVLDIIRHGLVHEIGQFRFVRSSF